MNKPAVLVIAAVLTSAGPAAASAAPGDAPTGAAAAALPSVPDRAKNPKCVTRKEYRKVKKGMKLKRVARIIGGKGRLTSSGGGMKVRRHEACKGRPYYAQVTYRAKRVYTKYGYFG